MYQTVKMINIKNILRNKKGENLLVDFWAILLFVLVLLVFLIIFIVTKDSAKDNELRVQLVRTDLSYMMNSYLKSPSLNDGSKTNGEIISEDALNNNFYRTENSFKAFFTGVETLNAEMKDEKMQHYSLTEIKLCVYDSADSFLAGYQLNVKTKTITNLYMYCGTPQSIVSAKTTLPTRDSFIYVETVLFGDILSK